MYHSDQKGHHKSYVRAPNVLNTLSFRSMITGNLRNTQKSAIRGSYQKEGALTSNSDTNYFCGLGQDCPASVSLRI